MGIHPSLASIFAAHGLEPSGSGPVFRTANGKYYGKAARSRRAAAQMRGEAASLAAMLRTAPPGLIPRVLGYVDADVGALVTDAVPLLLGNITPPPVPVPLHGDLWPGNVAGATIYDPAGYYGHGEADLGMTRMFGGFSQAFYDAYHSIHPKSQPYYDQRIRLYELYHHLNHALMFGGGYTGGAVRIMDELADWAEAMRT
ncbi:hypothetical protein CspHIS471_0108870 [Cutaneotrichosporon sp. HIS471]|nr:hypothetical protein CspHIS471_0108870 [Cutaneotrichosporon sp. HIS471]